MSEALPFIATSKMRNDVLPSLSSRLLGYGNNEVQLENLKASMQMDDLIHFHSNGLNMESRIFNNGSQLDNGCNTMPSHSQSLLDDIHYNHQPGSLHGISCGIDISHQQPFMLCKKPSVSQYEQLRGNGRKRPFEATDNMALLKKMKSSPKGKITDSLEPKWHQAREDSEEIQGHKLHVPAVRRNQKLSEKITTLQKLVSPYGKTDTASVLHEASLYIKLLQDQIRNLFQMLSFSYNSTVKLPHTQEYGNKVVDLRSRGLCLVPISITQKVTMEDQILHDGVSSRINMPRKF